MTILSYTEGWPIDRFSIVVNLKLSRSLRIVAALLTLVQLGVWSTVAPLHRLAHHRISLQQNLQQCRALRSTCHSSCCSHRHAIHESRPDGVWPEKPVNDTPHQCPHDENHCGLCAIALLYGDEPAAAPEITNPVIKTGFPLIEPTFTLEGRPRLFDCRGPPKV